MDIVHVDFVPVANCQNFQSYGEICVKCNKCGRFGIKEVNEEMDKLEKAIDNVKAEIKRLELELTIQNQVLQILVGMEEDVTEEKTANFVETIHKKDIEAQINGLKQEMLEKCSPEEDVKVSEEFKPGKIVIKGESVGGFSDMSKTEVIFDLFKRNPHLDFTVKELMYFLGFNLRQRRHTYAILKKLLSLNLIKKAEKFRYILNTHQDYKKIENAMIEPGD